MPTPAPALVNGKALIRSATLAGVALTVSGTVAVTVPEVATMLQLPAPVATTVTLPVESTVATAVFDEDQVTVGLATAAPAASLAVTDSCLVSPGNANRPVELAVSEDTGLTGAGAGAGAALSDEPPPPQAASVTAAPADRTIERRNLEAMSIPCDEVLPSACTGSRRRRTRIRHVQTSRPARAYSVPHS